MKIKFNRYDFIIFTLESSTSPKKRFGPFTWLGWINFLILQWFFIRIFYFENGCLCYWGFWFFIPFKGWKLNQQGWRNAL